MPPIVVQSACGCRVDATACRLEHSAVEVQAVRSALEACLQHLEWEARTFPAALGCAVRSDAIDKARAALGRA